MRSPHSITRGVSAVLVTIALAGGTALAQSSGALIEKQDETQVLTDDLIGMNIYSTSTESENPEHIGEVTSLLLDADDRLAGIVVSIGGFLGFGAKAVALAWSEVEVRKWDDTAYGGFVTMNRAELEEAPEFKTLARIKADEAAERERQQLQQQQEQTGTGTGTGTATQ
ncbi:MAG TPA: PRC-barrel domain-containing protein [Thermohalobaculum sp.]|nr:PRC-barrel domain-containing protein [Thermohalobaculum sp.]